MDATEKYWNKGRDAMLIPPMIVKYYYQHITMKKKKHHFPTQGS